MKNRKKIKSFVQSLSAFLTVMSTAVITVFCMELFINRGNAIGFMKLDGMKEPPKNISSLIATQAGSNIAFVMGYQGKQLGLLADAKINLRDLQEIENLSFDKGREQPKNIER